MQKDLKITILVHNNTCMSKNSVFALTMKYNSVQETDLKELNKGI